MKYSILVFIGFLSLPIVCMENYDSGDDNVLRKEVSKATQAKPLNRSEIRALVTQLITQTPIEPNDTLESYKQKLIPFQNGYITVKEYLRQLNPKESHVAFKELHRIIVESTPKEAKIPTGTKRKLFE